MKKKLNFLKLSGVFFFSFLFAGIIKAAPEVEVREVSLQDSFKALVEEKEQLERELKMAEREKENFRSRLTLQTHRVQAVGRRIESLEERLAQAQDKKKGKEEELNRLRAELKKAEKEISRQEKFEEDLLTRLRQEIFQEAGRLKKARQKEEPLPDAGKLKPTRQKDKGKMHYNQGNQLFRKGNYRAAAEKYRQALNYLPQDSDLYYNLGLVYDYHLNRAEKALVYYRRYLELNPESEEAFFVKERIVHNELRAKMERGAKRILF